MSSKNPSISISNPFEKVNDEIAVCYLTDPAESDKKIAITKTDIRIIMQTSRHDFKHEEIRGIQLVHSRLLFYVITGGIAVPLSLLGIFEQVMSTGLLLMICLAGLGMLYHGLNGSPGIRIWMKNFFQTIPLSSITPTDHLIPFLSFYSNIRSVLNEDLNQLIVYATRTSEGYVMHLSPETHEDGFRVDLLKVIHPVSFAIHGGDSILFSERLNASAILDKS